MERQFILPLLVILCLAWMPLRAHAHEGPEFNSRLLDFTSEEISGNFINASLTAWGLTPMRKTQPGQFRSAGYRIDLSRPLQMQTVTPVLYLDNFSEEQVDFSLRFSSDSLEWGAWQVLTHHEPWGPADSQLVADPFFVGAASRFFQLRITFPPTQLGEEPVRVRAIRFDYFTPGNLATIGPQDLVSHPILGRSSSPACDCEPPLFATRTEWGCPDGQSPSCAQPAYAPVSHLIVHHSATPSQATNWAAVVLSIWTYHTQSNDWCDIGYNWLIAPDGVVYEGRGGGNNVRGAHFCGANTGTMGICMLGTYDERDPTPAALTSLRKLLAWKGCDASLIVTDTVFHASSGKDLPVIAGHRDGCNTLCPGAHLHEDLPFLRTAVASDMAACAITSVADRWAMDLRVFPNPSNGQLTIAFTPETAFEGELFLISSQGQGLHQERLRLPAGPQHLRLDWPHLSEGLYYLRITSPRQQVVMPILIQY